MYHISDRKKEPSNPFLPDPDQVRDTNRREGGGSAFAGVWARGGGPAFAVHQM
jgi:hypothetical protein